MRIRDHMAARGPDGAGEWISDNAGSLSDTAVCQSSTLERPARSRQSNQSCSMRQHDPVQTTKKSVHGAMNMLGLAKRLKRRIFQASTSEV
jgi:hypothetical protein